jgi:copper(I)-binding protein
MGALVVFRIRPGILAVLFGLLMTGTASATGISADGVWCRVSDYRARIGFVYMTLTIRGEPVDKLIGASTPLAETVTMIAPVMEKKRERLQAVEAIELDAHAPTVLQPQGPHFLLKGLRHRLQPGQSFVMTLNFAKTGQHDVTVHVRASAPADGSPGLPKGVKLN